MKRQATDVNHRLEDGIYRVAIVGLGPWGLCALERVANHLGTGGPGVRSIEIHVIEPGRPGTGIYDVIQPDYLLMNNACSEISCYPAPRTEEGSSTGIGLHEWALAQGYGWVDHRRRVARGGIDVRPEDFLPRRVMGEYLQWVYDAVVSSLSRYAKVSLHATRAVDILPSEDHREVIQLEDGGTVVADQVLLTVGHSRNTPEQNGVGVSLTFPYPITEKVEPIPARAKVAVLGMGLVAMDVVWALTVGRGGRFVRAGDDFSYAPSGREPTIDLVSRSGRPYRSKTKTTDGSAFPQRKEAIFFTPQVVQQLRNRRRSGVDFRKEVLPILLDEMTGRYYAQAAFLAAGEHASAAVIERLRRARNGGRFAQEVHAFEASFGNFDAAAMFFAKPQRYTSSRQYHATVCRHMFQDIQDATAFSRCSPTVTAVEVFRQFRDAIRSVVEFGSLTPASHAEFLLSMRTRINRLVAGHPIWRIRQLLALADAGVVRFPYGPAPDLEPAGSERTRVCSTQLVHPYACDVDFVVQGFLDDPQLASSATPLLKRLHARGRVTSFRNQERDMGSVNLTADGHPIASDGSTLEHLWVFGPLTEGIRYFTHYIPSPQRGARAFSEIEACAKQILASQRPTRS